MTLPRLVNAARLGCVLLFAVWASAMAFAQQPPGTDLNRLIAFFYRDARPEQLAEIFPAQHTRALTWMAYPPVAGLMARSFALHPDWIERLTPTAQDSKAASTLVAAVRLSGHAAEAGRLRTQLKTGFDESLEQQFGDLPTRLEDIQIKSPSDLDILWGASFAAGEGRYVSQIIEFFAGVANESELVALDVARITVAMAGGPKDIYVSLKDKYGEARAWQLICAATALWAIGSNTHQHEYVRQATADYIEGHRGSAAVKALTAITRIK